MKYSLLPKTDLKISSVGFGCWAIGKWGWKGVDDSISIKAVHEALDCGINIFDTAPVYGFGHSEIILSAALGMNRKNVVIATKTGLVWDSNKRINKNLSAESIYREIDESLKRLNTDYIDLYQIHWPDKRTSFEETFNALNNIKQKGKIRYIGVSNFSLEQLMESVKYADIVSIQQEYNLLERSVEAELLPFCAVNNIGMISYSSLAKGLLTGKYCKGFELSKKDIAKKLDNNFQQNRLEQNLDKIEKIKMIASEEKISPAVCSVAWILRNPTVVTALCGAKNPVQIKESSLAGNFTLSDDSYRRLLSL